MDMHDGRSGQTWVPEILVGGKTTSKNLIHGFSNNDGCYSLAYGFFHRYTMSQTGGSVTLITERYFTEYLTFLGVKYYIREVTTVKFEFSSISASNNRYAVSIALYRYSDNVWAADMFLFIEDTSNTVIGSAINWHSTTDA